ncbi:MAG: alpha-amylase family glycosyl hydrolase [Chloroherpetonaceae bacterium]|nr:alpha-amylase family glycosyl hydrolase [Chloroherpetonaceae bacterium]MDW8438773.1 alpha-amylase family glycosyl hydrolase [Chloroherpetonaceae bacterium]
MRQTEFEFHVSRNGRKRYQLEDRFFSIRGVALFPNFQACQEFSAKVNAQRAERGVPESQWVRTAEVFAAALLHEVFHFVISVYQDDVNPAAFQKCEAWVRGEFGDETTRAFLLRFIDEFPTLTIYRGDESAEQFLARSSDGVPNAHVALEELMLVWIENQNPALAQLEDLIDDETLARETPYNQIITSLDQFFATQPAFGAENLPLLRLLLAPIKAAPNSILDQLRYIVEKWDAIISRSPALRKLLLQSIDFVREEGKYFLMLQAARADKERQPLEVRQAQFFGDFEKETPPVADYKSAIYEEAPENFTPDLNWMPRLVLMAKNAYVWLDQLSKTYKRPIKRLDDIPDEELDTLARRGFTGLWLIGVWERSHASKRIKHLNGNIDAIASAYALDDYVIANDLGGYDAYLNLRERARKRGIRLASDMVPNHMGIDSKWVINHPEWFLQLDYPPFPNYTFRGPDLSNDPRVGIFIEDGYWRKTDAAVVFARLDRWTGEVRYIYHGNDGTNMPWNDTAQLNFLKPEVREQVIQTILRVAKMFPIIRFDAAMVLAKQHVQRLWFPEPGKGGAIPSRAAFAMTKEEFDQAMPNEFWREVVDRVQQEAPDTLLLAEAFWMLEGYFVRTLGMHRVYNSAFMHMFKKEENAQYRKLIKDTLEYDPRILKRYVNFMNNPDEETAVKQFGKGDKYFGVCAMMCAMPGLPMFGHGQIEGFAEKYGMEYQRAYYDETPDPWLVARHEKEIFPLLKKRYLFAEVENFRLYDFIEPSGKVNDDVFAFSNRYENERALAIYHNKYAETSGAIKRSAPFLDVQTGKLVQTSIAEGLALSDDPGAFVLFRDATTGLEFLRPTRDVWTNGLRFHLRAYEHHVFLDFREVKPSALFPYDELWRQLGEAGVPSLQDAVLELSLRPLHAAIQEAFAPETFLSLYEGEPNAEPRLKETLRAIRDAMRAVQPDIDIPKSVIDQSLERYRAFCALKALGKNKKIAPDLANFINGVIFPEQPNGDASGRALLGYAMLAAFNQLDNPHAKNLLTDFRLDKFVAKSLEQLGLAQERAQSETALTRILLDIAKTPPKDPDFVPALYAALDARFANVYLGVNLYDGIVYFNKERYETLLGALVALWALETARTQRLSEKTLAPLLAAYNAQCQNAIEAEFKYDHLLERLKRDLEPKPEPAPPAVVAKAPKARAAKRRVADAPNVSDQAAKPSPAKTAAKQAKPVATDETELRFSTEIKRNLQKQETELRFSTEIKKAIQTATQAAPLPDAQPIGKQAAKPSETTPSAQTLPPKPQAEPDKPKAARQKSVAKSQTSAKTSTKSAKASTKNASATRQSGNNANASKTTTKKADATPTAPTPVATKKGATPTAKQPTKAASGKTAEKKTSTTRRATTTKKTTSKKKS